MSKPRIWELDALRGLCILGMAAVHLIYDLTGLYGLIHWEYPPLLSFVMNWGGVVFVLLSGLCATLGHNCLKRGAQVFSCGMLCTAVTIGIYLLGFSRDVIIYFGVLHCLGVCMVLWHPLKKLPSAALAIGGGIAAAAGLWLRSRYFSFPWLIPLGFTTPDFVTADYFPLLPYLGFFLLGAVLGRLAYPNKESLLPRVNANLPPLRFLCGCGRHSLLIYLLHQPVITGLLWAVYHLF